MSDKEPFTYVINTELWKKQLVVLFSILLILSVFIYYSIYYTQNWEDVEVISRATFDLLVNKAKLPEGSENRNFLTTGDTIIDPSNFTVEDLDALVGFQECPENQCAIDLETGVKRCPENGSVRIVYNNSYESCTAKYYCTSEKLPYAILSSGETDTFGVCDDDVICRCTDKIVCPNYVTATINLRNGNNYSSQAEFLNYYFIQRVGDPDSVTGYEGIPIDKNRQNKEFCAINPSYTNRMDNGCNFANTDVDILGCLDSQDFYEVDEESFEDAFGSDFDLYFQNTSDYKTQAYSNSVNIQSANKPERGFAVYDDGAGNYDIINFNQFDGDSITLGDEAGTVASDIVSLRANDSGVDLELGMPTGTQQGNGFSGYKFSKIIYTGCRNSSTKTRASNRSMLLCTQPDVQPCNEGVFTYIVNDKEPTNFCKFTQTFLQSRDELKLDPLNDPKEYTLSCVTGTGCLPNYSTSFCDGDNCDTAIEERKTDFYPEYDTSAASSVWILNLNQNPIAGTITYQYSQSGGIVLKNAGMLTIEKGDYYSASSQIYTKLVTATANVPAGDEEFTLNIGNTTGLVVGYLIFYPNFKGQILTIPNDTSITLKKLDGDATEITEYTLIRFFNKVTVDDDGNKFGQFWIDDDGKIFPAKLENSEKYVWPEDGKPQVLFVYKQFGYNGINYNTRLEIIYTDEKLNVQRRYSTSSKWYYWMYQKDIRFYTPPISSDIVPLSRTVSDNVMSRSVINAITFSDPDADFKKSLSFYYPVWNKDLNKQTCSLCTPNTITYSKIIPVSPTEGRKNSLFSAVIQFSGMDYGQYMYNPLLAFNEDTRNYTVSVVNYSFNFFTNINESLSTTRRIVLREPNPNIPLSSDVNENYYATNKYTLLDSSNLIRRRVKFVVPEMAEPLPDTITLSMLEENMADNQYETVMLDNRYDPYTYNDQLLKIPKTDKQTFSRDSSNAFYSNNERLAGSNYFGGKVYYYQSTELFVESEVSIVSVEINNRGEQVITTDSKINTAFSGETDLVLQVISHQDTLEVDYKPKTNDESLYVNGITQGRITDFTISDGGKNFFISNLPEIILTRYRRLE